MQALLENCKICPVECGANRTLGVGACGVNSLSIAKYYLHPFEEPCISFEKGSGTIFFSGCKHMFGYEEYTDIKDYSMKNRTYRYFEGTPLYPFGYGLTYGNCVATDMSVNVLDNNGFDGAEVTVKVKNIGDTATEDAVGAQSEKETSCVEGLKFAPKTKSSFGSCFSSDFQ